MWCNLVCWVQMTKQMDRSLQTHNNNNNNNNLRSHKPGSYFLNLFRNACEFLFFMALKPDNTLINNLIVSYK